MATLHIMVGLPCSGKTTRAKQLEAEHNAIRLTPDEWQLRLFGDDVGDPDHDRRHTEIERIMWEIAEHALSSGVNVVQDYGLWGRDERDDFKARAIALGADWELHVMDVSREELFHRLHKRNAEAPGGVFIIPDFEMESYLKVYQPPTPDEWEKG